MQTFQTLHHARNEFCILTSDTVKQEKKVKVESCTLTYTAVQLNDFLHLNLLAQLRLKPFQYDIPRVQMVTIQKLVLLLIHYYMSRCIHFRIGAGEPAQTLYRRTYQQDFCPQTCLF